MRMTDSNITKLPTQSDREFFRVDGVLYMYCEAIEVEQTNQQDGQGFFIPTFVQEEDDFVGLSIDAFREKVIIDAPDGKEHLLQIQQLMAMMKRFFDAEILGRKQKLYKKVKVNISGSGLSFPSDVAYHAGQFLKLSLYFPRFPFSYLTVIGDVVRSEKAEIGYEVKIKYKNITEKTQEEILKFVNQCQRDSIRSHK